MKSSTGAVLEYVFSGALLLAAGAILAMSVAGVEFQSIGAIPSPFGGSGVFLEGAALVLLAAVAYPVGYLCNIVSFPLMNRLGRHRRFVEFSRGLPVAVRERLEGLYVPAWGADEKYRWKEERRHFSLLVIQLQHRDSELFEKGAAVWEGTLRASRVFFATFLLVALLLGVSMALSDPALPLTVTQGWFLVSGCLALSASHALIYFYALRREFQSYLARYLVAFEEELVGKEGQATSRGVASANE